MDISTITPASFRALFRRDFPYLNNFDPAALYNIGDRVYYAPTQFFYDCIQNGTIDIFPTVVACWKPVINADGSSADSIDNYVSDDDIIRAQAEAATLFNYSLFGTDDQVTMGFQYLTAMFLTNDIQAALVGAGIGGSPFALQSRSVGGVSESYGIPARFLENPIYSLYTQNRYGLKYFAMVLPSLTGNIFAVQGGTNP